MEIEFRDMDFSASRVNMVLVDILIVLNFTYSIIVA